MRFPRRSAVSRDQRCPRTLRQATVLLGVFVVLASSPAAAHVALDQPNGGESLDAGAMTTIQWHIIIGHDTLNWDLWYSVSGPTGPWIEIALDIPAGVITTGAVHQYQWHIPAVDSSQVRIRVRRDNASMDYQDASDGDLAIVGGLFGDGFESSDTSGWTVTTP